MQLRTLAVLSVLIDALGFYLLWDSVAYDGVTYYEQLIYILVVLVVVTLELAVLTFLWWTNRMEQPDGGERV